MSFFGLHGIRLALTTHLGPRPAADPSGSGLVRTLRGQSRQPPGTARKATEKPSLQNCAIGDARGCCHCHGLCSGRDHAGGMGLAAALSQQGWAKAVAGAAQTAAP